MKKIDTKKYYFMEIPSQTEKIPFKKIVLVSIPKPLKEFSCLTLNQELMDYVTCKNDIFELAITNNLRNQFILINEFDKKIIRKAAGTIDLSKFDPCEFEFKYPEIFVDNESLHYSPLGNKFRLDLTQEQYDEGIEISVLKKQNNINIQKQFQTLLLEIEKRKSRKPYGPYYGCGCFDYYM